jgi:hypothetical protein
MLLEYHLATCKTHARFPLQNNVDMMARFPWEMSASAEVFSYGRFGLLHGRLIDLKTGGNRHPEESKMKSLDEKTPIAVNERLYTEGVICGPESDEEPEEEPFSTGNEGDFED